MTNEASQVAAGDAVGDPLPPARDDTPFTVRKVPLPTAAERQARRDAMERAIRFGAAPYRDAEGKARYVFFRETNNAPVEAWRHDREAKRGYRRTQYARKAAGQMAWHPEDQIELGKRLGVIYYREGRSAEGAAERGLYDAIWRYEHVFDSFTVPRRFGREIIETGRIAAVAEEEGRKLQAEDPRAIGGFWVRDRKNNGLIYVVPNAGPQADQVTAASLGRSAESTGDILSGSDGDGIAFGQAEVPLVLPLAPEEMAGPEVPARANAAAEEGASQRLKYPDIPLLALEPTWEASEISKNSRAGRPVINMEQDRIRNILDNKPAVFEIVDSPRSHSEATWYEFEGAGYAAVWVYQDVIEYEARKQGVDPDLIKAIVYFECARGASYGHAAESADKVIDAFTGNLVPWRFSDSILPMNIKQETWGALVGPGKSFRDPLVNIKAGVILIRRIVERLKNPSVAKVASIYNFAGYENVADNGARVAEFYNMRVWKRRPSDMSRQHEKYLQRQRNALRRRIPRD